jgi:hypothetical protein
MRKIYPARAGWHPAFVQALRLELELYRKLLRFQAEYQLTSEPLRADLIVIKKRKNLLIEKNIAAGFRLHNIIEYKSPGDYISVSDFYRVCSYASLYISQTGIDETDLGISFVSSRHPRKLISCLENIRGNTVEEKSPGIYSVKGNAAAIQIVDTRRLPEGDNLWLKGLREAG